MMITKELFAGFDPSSDSLASLDNGQELLVQVRKPRNGAKGYIVNFYKGKKHVAWHHQSSGSVVDLDKTCMNYFKEKSIPSERSIVFNKPDASK